MIWFIAASHNTSLIQIARGMLAVLDLDQTYSSLHNKSTFAMHTNWELNLIASYCCRFCKFSTAGKTAPGVKMKLEPQRGGEDGCGGSGAGGGRREVCGYGRNIFMGYLNRDNETKVSCQANDNIFLGYPIIPLLANTLTSWLMQSPRSVIGIL